jgi:predicted P-loop ATPase
MKTLKQMALEEKKNKSELRKELDRLSDTSKLNKSELEYSALKHIVIQIKEFLFSEMDFRINVVNQTVEMKEKDSKNWTIANENTLFFRCIANGFNITPNKIGWLLNSDEIYKHNPFIEYFDSLKWNPKNKSEIDRLLTYIKVKDQERFNKHFKKTLVRCIACSTVKGPVNYKYNKQCLVLRSGGQSKGKSSFINWLCPPDLKEYLIDKFILDKDGEIALSTMFIINLDELQSISNVKADLNRLKAAIQSRSINERLPYAKRREMHPRRANFFGSTNEVEFLRDTTGSVRWLVFELIEFSCDFYTNPFSPFYIDINKIWAEAKHLYDNGFEYELSPQELKENDIANEAFRDKSIEEELILTHFEEDPDKNNHYTTGELTIELMRISDDFGYRINKKAVGDAARKHFQEVSFRKSEKKDSPRYGFFIRKKGFPKN